MTQSHNRQYTLVKQSTYTLPADGMNLERKINFLTGYQSYLRHKHYCVVEDFLSEKDCDYIIHTYFPTLQVMDGQISGKNVNKETRDSSLRWLRLDDYPDSAWLYSKIFQEVSKVNDEHWTFQLNGFESSIQLTEYEKDGHYTWHQDIGANKSSLRKLSISIQLSCPNSYQGGNLELHSTQKPVSMVRSRGALVIFPSYTLHRVTPVTDGNRKALVTWIGGVMPYQ